MKTIRFTIFICLLFIINTFTVNAQFTWERKKVGYANCNNLVISEGRNDGVMRIYGATFDGSIYEFTYDLDSKTWNRLLCTQIMEDPNGYGPVFYALQSGDGHNDGKQRLYAANNNGFTYELTFDNISEKWIIEKLDQGGFYKLQGISIGDSRNDNTNRVITCGISFNGVTSPYVNEYSWKENSKNYVLNYMDNENRFFFQGQIGKAKNDDKNYIYFPDNNSFSIIEYEWTGENYVQSKINVSNTVQRLVIGDARNEGMNRIYTSDGFYSPGTTFIKELNYENNSWVSKNIHSSTCPRYSRHEIAIGAARTNDTKNRLYSIARDGALVEHTYIKSNWESKEIDAVSGATATIGIGKARNDDTTRIYVSGNCGIIYEYAYVESNNVLNNIENEQSKEVNIVNYPNPCTDITTIQFNVHSNLETSLYLFDNTGKQIRSIKNIQCKIGYNEILFDCSQLNPGIYYYILVSNDKKIGTNKLIVN